MGGIPRSLWIMALVTYRGASTIALSIFDWYRGIMTIIKHLKRNVKSSWAVCITPLLCHSFPQGSKPARTLFSTDQQTRTANAAVLTQPITIYCTQHLLGVTFRLSHACVTLDTYEHRMSEMTVQTVWPDRPTCNKGVQIKRVQHKCWYITVNTTQKIRKTQDKAGNKPN
jgi:hypothetical protein